jgi:hypothetical protein
LLVSELDGFVANSDEEPPAERTRMLHHTAHRIETAERKTRNLLLSYRGWKARKIQSEAKCFS